MSRAQAWARLHNAATDLSGVQSGEAREYTMDDVRKHNTRDDAWMVIHGMIYNVTPYMRFHPGGVDELMKGVGGDGTAQFMEVHRWVTPMTMLQVSECAAGAQGCWPVADAHTRAEMHRRTARQVAPSRSSGSAGDAQHLPVTR